MFLKISRSYRIASFSECHVNRALMSLRIHLKAGVQATLNIIVLKMTLLLDTSYVKVHDIPGTLFLFGASSIPRQRFDLSQIPYPKLQTCLDPPPI